MSRAEQIQRLFNEIVDLDPNARVAYLDQACSDDAIRREVESLLAAYDERATKVRSRRRPGVLAIQFPPLQTTLLEAVELMIQPQGPEFEQVLDLVERDPGVATRLLHMANAAYYGQRRPVSNIHRAVMIMGAVPVTEMVLALSLQQVPLDRPARLASAHLMRHSMATAFLARHLLARDPAPPRGQPGRKKRQREVFTAALLHDIGKLVLLYNYPGAASAFYRAASDSSKPDAEVLAQERALFGHDHGAAGGYLSDGDGLGR